MGAEISLDAGTLFEPAFRSEWTRCALWDTAVWVNGLAFRNIAFSDRGDPVIRIAELKNGISPTTNRTMQTFDARYRVTAGDVLYSWSGSPETSLDVFVWSGPDGWLNQHIFKVATVAGVDRNWHIQLLRYLRPQLVAIATNKQTTGLGHVTQQDMRRMTVAVPPLCEQREIARILGALDDKIELNRQMNETLEAMARALFKSWFIDFDPVRAKQERRAPFGMDADTAALFPHSFEDSELGPIPKGWRIAPLRSACELKRGYDLPQRSRAPGAVPIVSSSGVTGFHNEAKADPPGVVTGRYGTIGSVFFLRTAFWPLNTTLYVRDFCGNEALFVFHLLRRVEFSKYVDKAAVPGINRNHLHLERIVIPPVAIQRRFADVAVRFEDRRAHNERESRTLAELRDSLLPKLISGELRIPEAAAVAEVTQSVSSSVP